jgi:hypothetical protein
MLRLTDDELDTVFAGARPLQQSQRDAYLQAVADALKGVNVGPGTVYRVVRECQRQFFDPPTLDGGDHPGKYA